MVRDKNTQNQKSPKVKVTMSVSQMTSKQITKQTKVIKLILQKYEFSSEVL